MNGLGAVGEPLAADLNAAIRLVSTGVARSVTVVGVADPAAAAALGAASRAGVAIAVVTAATAAGRPTAVRFTRAVVDPSIRRGSAHAVRRRRVSPPAPA
jgi:hypothetical protein